MQTGDRQRASRGQQGSTCKNYLNSYAFRWNHRDAGEPMFFEMVKQIFRLLLRIRANNGFENFFKISLCKSAPRFGCVFLFQINCSYLVLFSSDEI